MSGTSEVETKSWSHDAVDMWRGYLKGVPRKAQQSPAQEPSRAHLEVHVDSYWAGEMVSRRSTSEVIARTWTFRHSSTVQNVIGLSSAESEAQYWSAKLVCRLESEATTLTAYRFFESESNCLAKRNWQEHPSYTDDGAVATRTCSSKTLTSCESGNRIKSCRHVDENTWEIGS